MVTIRNRLLCVREQRPKLKRAYYHHPTKLLPPKPSNNFRERRRRPIMLNHFRLNVPQSTANYTCIDFFRFTTVSCLRIGKVFHLNDFY